MESLANMPRRPRPDKENTGATSPLPIFTFTEPPINTKDELVDVLHAFGSTRARQLHFENVLNRVNMHGSSPSRVQEVFEMLTHLALYAPTSALLCRVSQLAMDVRNTQQWEEVNELVDDIMKLVTCSRDVVDTCHGSIWVRRWGPPPVSPDRFTAFMEQYMKLYPHVLILSGISMTQSDTNDWVFPGTNGRQ